MPPHLCIMQTTNDSARLGRNQEKEKKSSELNIFLSKVFLNEK